MRQFNSGATRNEDADRIDYEGFLSPIVLRRYAQYMNGHRIQADGQLRDSDNWQKGIPKKAHIKGLWRHLMDLWLHHRGYGKLARHSIEDALCAIIFNACGYLYEILKGQEK